MRELENLLREIAEQQQPARPRPAPPRAPQPQPAGQAPRPQRPAPSRPGAGQPAEVLDAEIVDAAPVRRHAAAVAKQVEKHPDTSDVTARATRLGSDVVQAAEKLEARLHEKFDHQSSRMDDPDDKVGAAAGAAFAARIAELFRDPQGIQQAFILNEIINRPEVRW
jgi:hypothetical protein